MHQRDFARHLRANSTDAERLLWRRLRRRQLNGFRFRRQCPIGRYIVDFVSFEAMLIIELDGGQHQGRNSYDRGRDAELKKRGFAVLRFWNNEVMQQTDAVLERIERCCRRAC